MQLRAFGTVLPLRAGVCRAARPAQPVLVRASAQHKQQQSHGVIDSGLQQPQLPSSAGASTAVLAMAGLLAPLLLDTNSALAVPSLLTGRSFALIHPGGCLEGRWFVAWMAVMGFQACCVFRRQTCFSCFPLPLVLRCSCDVLPLRELPVGCLPRLPVAPHSVSHANRWASLGASLAPQRSV